MSLQPVQPEDQIQKACQVGLAALSNPSTSIPGNMLDGVQSFKAIINAVISGTLVICRQEAPKVEVEAPKTEVAKKSKKKAAPRKKS